MFGDDTTTDYYPDEAFIAATTGNALFGEPIRNFSFNRKIAAQAMGCQAPILSAEARDAMTRTGVYPGALNDTIIVLWLCTLKDNSELTTDDYKAGVFTPERATNQPTQAIEQARAWAEAKKLDNIAGDEFFEAWKMFLHIMFGIDASVFEVEVEKGNAPALEGRGPKEKPAKPTRRTSSRTSRK